MPKIISVGGGKGGVGKSFFSANIGALLAMIGKKTLVVDLDTGGPNLHSFYAIINPDTGVQDFFDQKKKLENCIIKTNVSRLSLLTSKNCREDIGNLPYSQRKILLSSLKYLKYDYILLDLGAGVNKNMIDFFLLADFPFVVFTEDPLSMENAFRFVHRVYIQKIKNKIPVKKLNKYCDSLFKKGGTIRPVEILRELESKDEEYYKKVKFTLDSFNIFIVSNKSSSKTLGMNIENFYRKFFGENISFLGNIPYSKNAEKAILKRELFVSSFKSDKAVKKLMTIAKFLL